MLTSSGIDASEDGKPVLSRRRLLVISVLSGVVYIGISWLIYRFLVERPMLTMFDGGRTVGVQVAYGCIFGAVSASLIGGIFFRTSLQEILSDYEIIRYIMQLRLRAGDILQISCVAGATEEVLFRGTIQPLIGIWWTSVIFVGLHGYFRWDSPGHLLFGGLMFSLSVGLGYLCRDIGLAAAMVAHAVYDFLMLFLVNQTGWLRS